MWALLALAVAAQAPAAPVSNRHAPRSQAELPGPPGWNRIRIQTFRQFPWGLDARTAAAMREFGLARRQEAWYARGPGGPRLRTTVLVFADGRGSYGAGTFLRATRHAGAAAVAPPARQLARRRWLLMAQGPISAAAWKRWVAQVAGKIPSPQPVLRQRLPRDGLVAHSAGYAEGPAGLAVAAPWLPAAAVNFAMEPLIATGNYGGGASPRGQLAILSYPTPQIAAAQLREIAPYASVARRSGSLVVAWHGAATAQSRRLVAEVQYRPLVTWSQPLGWRSLPGLILAIIALIGCIAAACLAGGLFAGGVRVLLAKCFPQRFGFRHDGIIRLKL